LNTASSTHSRFSISDFEQVKEKVLNWSKQFSTFCFLDNHQYHIAPHVMECLLAAGIKRQLKVNAGNAVEQLQAFIDEHPGWLFGHLGYDLKNEMEELSSVNPDHIHFPDLFFFEPAVVIRLTEKEMIIEAENPELLFAEIINTPLPEVSALPVNAIKSRIDRDEYVNIIRRLKKHILRGDCYEINFCQEFYAENVVIHPVEVYKKLSAVSPNPFSALYRLNDKWLICASPERFLKKTGNIVLSQPIKGTSRRVTADEEQDNQRKKELFLSAKDRSENVMVVDLVRNDLSKICEEGTVQVDELYGVYSFPQVHQMISTISGILRKDISFADILTATFPMGSMTGAPKKRVMELIEQYEQTKRGIFSGAIGYITPEGDFDFNVVIRSIMYNADTKYLSYQAGSGITYYSDPEMEWEECLLKAEAIKKVLAEG
jgi:para-aminobenzoate synthetase component I